MKKYLNPAMLAGAGLAPGHQMWFGIPIAVPDLPVPLGSLPSGQPISSAEDMGHYLIAHLNEGRYREVQILSPEGIAELQLPAVKAISDGIPMGHYGMGWYVEEQGPTRVVYHTGMCPDFYAYIALLPEQKKGVVLLVNANHFTGELTLTEVGKGVTALLTGNRPDRIQYGAIPWLLRGAPSIMLLQISGVFATRRLINRWRRNPQSHPSRGRLWGLYIVPAIIITLIPIISGLALLTSDLRGFLMLFMPDLSWLAAISGSFALAWSFLRTRMILHTLRQQRKQKAEIVNMAIKH